VSWRELIRVERETSKGSTLALVGEAHLELGNLTRVYAELLQEGLMDTLDKKLEDFKEFEKLLSRADKKRGQLEAVMIKVRSNSSVSLA